MRRFEPPYAGLRYRPHDATLFRYIQAKAGEEEEDIEKVADVQSGVSEENSSLSADKSTTIKSVADLFNLVKTYDKGFSPKPVNPLMLNEDGMPKVFYHGSPKQDISVFVPSKEGVFGEGVYFSESKE